MFFFLTYLSKRLIGLVKQNKRALIFFFTLFPFIHLRVNWIENLEFPSIPWVKGDPKQAREPSISSIMPSFSTLRRSSLPFIQRLRILHSSSSAPSLLNRKKWVLATVAGGTSLGLLLYSEFDPALVKTSLPSIVDCSDSASTSSDDQNRRRSSPSFFTKLSLPESSGGSFLVGGKFLSFHYAHSVIEKKAYSLLILGE